MMLYGVDQETKKGPKIFYKIVDLQRDGILVGTARVDYHKRKSFWTYTARDGRRIKDKKIQGAMYDAVTRYRDEIYADAN